MGKFRVFIDKDDKWRFNLHASNNQVILVSEGYASNRNVQRGIKAIKQNSLVNSLFKRHNKRRLLFFRYYWFTLTGRNHKIVGVSEMYRSVQAMEKGIMSVKINAYDAKIIYD